METGARPVEVIDLLSSSSDDDEDDVGAAVMHRAALQVDSDGEDEDGEEERPFPMAGAFPAGYAEAAPQDQPPQDRQADGGMIVLIDGEEIFIPDEKPQAVPGADPFAVPNNLHADQAPAQPDSTFTAEDCLQHVLQIFPDISHDHVRNLYASFDAERDYEALAGPARLDNIVEQLVSASSYPKQQKGKLKRKREDSTDGAADMKKWERSDRPAVPSYQKGSILAICKAEYPSIPKQHINFRFNTHQHLFHTFVALAKDVDDSEEGNRVFGRGRATKNASADADTIAVTCGHPELVDELAAARAKVAMARAQCEATKAKKRAEEENLQRAIAAGETTECSACFDDLPMNRQIHCNGSTAHFTCFGCAETYIKTEVGDSRCKVLCPAGCGAGFAYNQLNLLENKQLLEKLAQIQQEQDIRDAGLDDLEECPFCDFKAIMPPIEQDFEFRCANPECEKVSCRRCKAISHIPISCEQHAKDNKLSSRHQIEEAMTAALIRTCQKCKKVFIKESGCNKMHCMSCGTLQCYVCSQIVTDYSHFNEGPGARGRTTGNSKKCPLYDNVEERHEREVNEAEAKARAEIVEQNPEVSAEDLEIKVSDAVKKAEADKIKRAGGRFGPGAYGVRLGGPFANDGDGGLMDAFGVARDMLRGPGQENRHNDNDDDDGGEDEEDDAINEMLGIWQAPRGPHRRQGAADMRQAAAGPRNDEWRVPDARPGRRLGGALEGFQPFADFGEAGNGFWDLGFGQGLNQAPNGAVNAAAPLPHGYIPFYVDPGRQAPQQVPPAQPAEPQEAIRDRWAPPPHLDVGALRDARAVIRDFRQAAQRREAEAGDGARRYIYRAPAQRHEPGAEGGADGYIYRAPGRYPRLARAAGADAAGVNQENGMRPRPARPNMPDYPHVPGGFPLEAYRPVAPAEPQQQPGYQQPQQDQQQQQGRYRYPDRNQFGARQQELDAVRMRQRQMEQMRVVAARTREAVQAERDRLARVRQQGQGEGERERRPY